MSFHSSLRENINLELTLDEMLADPIVRKVMKSDSVDESHIRKLMTRQHEKRRASQATLAAAAD